MKRILCYLKGTYDVSLVYRNDKKCLMTGYSENDYAGDVGRSMTRFMFTLGGSVVNWKANLQPTIAFSTIELECMTLTEVAKEEI